jgi:hypothetical protein
MTTLSIFTCVIGEPPSLKNTAESIAPWLSDNINWIIKFSEKTDKNFINGFSGHYVTTHQESDSSLYEAMNQCLALSKSDFYMVLGAGDTLLADGAGSLRKLLLENALVGSAYHAPLFLEAARDSFYPSPGELRHRMSCPHPSSLLRVKNSLLIHGFDTSYRIASDYDHMSRYSIAFGNGETLNIPPPVSYMGGGISDVRALESYMEALLIRQRVWGTPDIRIFGDLLKYTATTISDNITQNYS